MLFTKSTYLFPLCLLVCLAHLQRVGPTAYATENEGESSPATTDHAPVVLDEDDLRFAEAAFEERCAMCHEADGNSEDARLNLVDEAWLHGGELLQIEQTIRKGVAGTLMKPQTEHFNPEQIEVLARYVKLLNQRAAVNRETHPAEVSAPPASAPVPEPPAAQAETSDPHGPFNFQREIGGILTKQGCNAADCHGGVKGRGGFKLSISVLGPRDDYDWIVKGGAYQVLTDEVEGERIPRVNLEQPEQSLLLLKPTMAVDHEGGKRLRKDSDDYRTILEWVRRGAPYDEEGAEGFRIERLEVSPREAVLGPEGEQQLVVTAHLVNGRREDVTDQVRYDSNNKEVVRVSPDGRISAGMKGEADVLVTTGGQVAAARFGVIEKTIEDYPEAPRVNFIDDHVFAKLRRYHIVPSGLSSDEEFLRRVCLDLTGTLPPPNRVREFLADADPDKRDKLIDILLETPEFIDYWVYRFGDIFRVRYAGAVAHGEIYWEWVRDCIAGNKPYDQIARERLAAQGYGGPSWFYPFNLDASRYLAEDLRLFMGRRFDCAQCHNHPSEAWSQDQFWGMTAFYGRMTQIDFNVLYDDPDGQEYQFGEGGRQSLTFKELVHPRTKAPVEPTFLDGTKPPEGPRYDPRLALAEWVTSHPHFAEAAANRVWSYFFGRGIVDPVDDFGAKNLPSHPELLEALARDFRENGHDLKRLMRRIVRSRTYQLSSRPNATNKDDKINFSHSRPRPLIAEVLLDALATVTGVPLVFDRSLGSVSGKPTGKAPPETRTLQLRDPVAWPSKFLEVYGRPDRLAIPERDGNPNLDQALHMLAGSTYTDYLAEKGGRIDRMLEEGLGTARIVEELYLAALSRYPAQEETRGILEYLDRQSVALTSSFFERSPARRKIIEDLLWGLVSSREFVYNH